jgi:hypothetical protein
MKCLFLCLLTCALAACNPVSRGDEDSEPAPKSQSAPASKSQAAKRTTTPTPIPKPGDWMEKKKSTRRLDVDNDLKADRLRGKPLGVKGDRLDEKPK